MADRKLVVKIVGDASSLERAFRRSGAAAQGFNRRITGALGSLARGGLFAAGAAAVGGLAAVIHEGTAEFVEHSRVAAQTGAVLKSTGGIAGVTQKQIEALALSLSNLSGIDDEAVQAGENVLLSFQNIRDAAGRGNDIFTQATKAAVDFAARTGRDVPQAALLFGKALEDPAKRLTSLARAGVVFNEAQVKQVTALQKSGRLLEAQKIILAELEKRYGGAAAAAGGTLPGKLNILRERFKDLSGELIGAVAPAFTTAITGITDFVKKLSEARGAKAKFNLVVDGIRGFGAKLFAAIEAEIKSIDLARTTQFLQNGIFALVRSLGQFLSRVNFRAVGKAIGDGIAKGVQGVAGFLASVDWGTVGRAIVRGIGNFLAGVNWVALARGFINLLIAAIKGSLSLLVGIGEELGKALLRGLRAGITRLGRELELQALKLVLKIVKVFDVTIPLIHKKLIPGLDNLIKSVQDKIAKVQASIDSLHGKTVMIKVVTPTGTEVTAERTGRRAPAPRPPRRTPAAAAPPAPPRPPGDDPATKALNARQRAIQKLNVTISRAGLTPGLKDDLAANQKLISYLERQIKLHKDDLDLQDQLVNAQQARNDLVKQQAAAETSRRTARQFRALGLGPTGDALIPSAQNLQKQEASLRKRVAGTTLDTSALRRKFAVIAKILAEAIPPAPEIRQKIQELFATIRQGLNDGASKLGTQTKFHKASANAILAGLGLDPDQMRALRSRLSQVGQGGTVPSHGPAAFGTALPAGGAFVIENNVILDGRPIASNTNRRLQQRRRRNPPQKRGPLAGV